MFPVWQASFLTLNLLVFLLHLNFEYNSHGGDANAMTFVKDYLIAGVHQK